MPSILGYWEIRGLANPIRMLLKYAGEDFEDKRYSIAVTQGPDGPVYSRENWMADKFKLGYDFPNLPYYSDGHVKVTQTNAILRVIGRKHNLCGSTEFERAHADMCAEQVMDLRNGFVGLCYNQKFNDLKAGYLEGLPAKLKLFQDYLGEKKYLVGDKPTFPDFHFSEMLDHHTILDPSCLDQFPMLIAYKHRFEALPAIKAFREAPENKLPLNGKMAAFGGSLCN